MDVSVNAITGQDAALVIAGHSVSASMITVNGSIALTNGATVGSTLTLEAYNLTVHDSTLNGLALVATPPGGAGGTADISHSTVQRLALSGKLSVSNNSTIGTANASGIQGSVINILGPSSINSNSSYAGSLVIDQGGSLDVGNSIINIPLFGLNIGVTGAGTMIVHDGAQITLAQGAPTHVGGAAGATGSLILNGPATAFTSNDQVTVGDRGAGKLQLENGATLTVTLPASSSPPAGAAALLLGSNSTTEFDIAPGVENLIDVSGPATLLGQFVIQQLGSFDSGKYIKLLAATETNVPIIDGDYNPYLRLSSAGPQEFTILHHPSILNTWTTMS
jgi:T5SS/PEP-CTERM-associated repeat protein